MCFSASASFTASAALAIVGTKAISKTQRNRAYLALAAIPFLFALQQALEGIIWLSLQNDALAFATTPASYGYLFFAYVLWPCWIPFSILLIARSTRQRITLALFLALGATVAATLLYYIIRFGAGAQIDSCHIVYTYQIPQLLIFWGSIGYLMATVLPFFVTSNKKMYVVGTLVALAYAVSYLFYTTYLTSVWCFFAAIISLAIVWVES
jgi:hypothetical protein